MSSDDSTYQVVLDYLTKRNRPFSLIDVSTNLGKEHNKAAVNRALNRMVQENKVIEKTYGKQKVYYVNQDQFTDVSDNDLKRMDGEISNLTTTLKEVQSMISSVEKEIFDFEKAISTSEAKAELEKLTAEIPVLEGRLAQCRQTAVKVDPKEKAALLSENDKFTSEWKKRKRMANDILNSILEGYPKPKKALVEEIAIETDEDAAS